MDEEKEETINQEETLNQEKALNLVVNDVLIPKPNNLVDPKSENIATDIKSKVESFDDKDFVWGIKQSGNKYKTVTIRNELYALNDCVRCRSGLELDYIGKIMKLSQENDQKVCTLRWFFRPFELPTSLKEIYKSANTRELFLAFGEGIGVENKNLLVSCYNMNNIRSYFNVENVVSLGVITGKCKVLCIAKDDFNDLPSSEHLDMCDFFFNKAFNCDTLNIVGLDGVVDAIGAQKVYNKKEWLNWNKNDMYSTSLTSSPKKILCQSLDSSSLAINPSDINALPLSYCNLSSLIIEQSIKKTMIEKRKRDSLEEVIPSKKMMEKTKKMKLSPTSKNPKLSLIVALTNQEDQATKCVSEVKSSVTIVDALNIGIQNSGPNLYEGSKLASDEMLNSTSEDGKIDGNPKNHTDLSSNTPIILEQTIEGVGNNADDIHVTCEGFPIENVLEPLEKSESSTSKLKKNESSLKPIIPDHETREIGKTLNSKKSKKTLAKERKTTSKGVQNKNIKKTSSMIVDTTLKEPTKTNSTKSNVSKRAQNKRKNVINKKIQDQVPNALHSDNSHQLLEDQQPLELPSDINVSKRAQNKRKKTIINGKSQDQVLNTSHFDGSQKKCQDLEDQQPLKLPLTINDSIKTQNKRKKVLNEKNQNQLLGTLHFDDPQKHCEDLMEKDELIYLEDQQSLESPFATKKPTTIDENLLEKRFLEHISSSDIVADTSIHDIAIPLEKKIELECEDWDDEIQKAIVAKRVLLLNNLDPELHSMELQEALSKFLETKCQVQKIMPNSFYYSTASALLKLTTPDIAQKSLQNLCKDCLIVGERTIIASLYEGLEGAKEFYGFYGHICIQPKCEPLKIDCIEMNVLPHAAQGGTIEFTFGLRWRLLQEQHELQWQLLNELHEKELNIIIKETKTNKRLKRSR